MLLHVVIYITSVIDFKRPKEFLVDFRMTRKGKVVEEQVRKRNALISELLFKTQVILLKNIWVNSHALFFHVYCRMLGIIVVC